MGKTFIFAISLLFLSWPTLAQKVTPDARGQTMITMEVAESLNNALLVLDRGSVDQCDGTKEKDAKTPERPCPFHKSLALVKAMAQNIVALKPIDERFKIEQNAVRTAVISEIPVPEGASDVAIKATQGKQDIRYLTLMEKINSEQVAMPLLAPIHLVDLDLEHNRIPAELIAALAPIIEELQGSPPVAAK